LFDHQPIDHENVNLSFFKKYEILNGLTLSDLYIKDPTVIKKAIARQEDTDIEKTNTTVIEDFFCNESEENLEIWKEINLFKGDSVLYINSDFYQENIISRAIQNFTTKTAWLIMEHVMNLDHASCSFYQHEIMKSMEDILTLERVDMKCMGFFDYFEEETDHPCFFEMPIRDEELPPFSEKQE
jgi:hypothetical protein